MCFENRRIGRGPLAVGRLAGSVLHERNAIEALQDPDSSAQKQVTIVRAVNYRRDCKLMEQDH